MNGAESLVRTAVAAGVDVCFANPGTTEMSLVAALDAVPGVRPVLGLFEGVCTGAADGYGRMTGRPAMTLLHLGPGFANGIANLHNARRANSPIVNLIGDHASWHLEADAPLTSDIESLAGPVSGFVRQSSDAKALAGDFAAALHAAMTPPGQVATLIIANDAAWDPAAGPVAATPPPERTAVGAERIDSVARALRDADSSLLLLGGAAMGEPGLRQAARVAAASGARLVLETFPARAERGAGRPAVERLPYFPEQAAEVLQAVQRVVLVGAREPVAFFGYPGGKSRLLPEDRPALALAGPEEDAVGALQALADALDAAAGPPPGLERAEPAIPNGPLDPGNVGAVLAALLPENAILVDEAATTGLPGFLQTTRAAPHSYLALTGGAIGQGLPCATGAAIACPDRRVIAFQADGSGMYTLQALWTQARESLDVTTLLCSNRAYRILQVELGRAGIAEPGPGARALTELSRPDLDWVALAKGMGVPGVRVERAEDFARELRASLAEPGPRLLELAVG